MGRALRLARASSLRLPDAPTRVDHDPNQAAESIVRGYVNKPTITEHETNRAFYRPSDDTVDIPLRGQFTDSDAFYDVLFHELGHSTGHASRLNRDVANTYGHHAYSKEELVAEMTSAFLCQSAGINSTMPNHGAYIEGWLSALNKDRKMLVWAAGKAQAAADYILGIKPADTHQGIVEQ